ncbi:hypothetical protein RND81_08G035500 [Saponaria officinalis]|uniref:Retrotransposon gag domain-containing protein n=1 Tax=Saponaria officinalis TaxID=3572 RepID=A0AAW1J3H1_SAPOF
MKPANATDEQLKLRAFPFSLKDAAKEWLYYLPENSIDTWLKMKQAFLGKYFPASRASQLKKEISNVEQKDGETLYEYWERFKRLCATCPYHGYADQDLILYFCGGLGQDDARMVHAASGGIVNKSPTEAKALIAELVESSRIFERKPSRRGVNAMGSSHLLEEKVDSLTSLVRDLVVGKQSVSVCGICSSDGHSSQQCPGMYEEQHAEVNAAGYMEPPHRKWDPYSNTYNSGWKDHPNFRWGNQQGNQRPTPPNQQGPPNYYFQKSPAQNFATAPPNANRELVPVQQPNTNRNIVNTQSNSSSQMSTEDLIRALATNQARFQQTQLETQGSIKNLEQQMGQLAIAISRLEARDSGVLPSTTVTNPTANVSAVSLRNGRQLVEAEKPVAKSKNAILHEEEEIVVEQKDETAPESVVEPESEPVVEVDVPFPEALKSTRRIENDKDIYETFRNCEVNIPLLNLLKCVPRYAKFLKELCTHKKKKTEPKSKAPKGKISEYVSALFQKRLPPKCGDSGMFTIPCTIGDRSFEKAMLDLGASINVIPHTVYESLNLGPLKETSVVIQLADRSSVHPKGLVENVMVKVGKLVFPTDFYILDMENEVDAIPVLLGRPFLKTAWTKIDVPNGSLTMQFDGTVVKFEISKTPSQSSSVHSLCAINACTNQVLSECREPPIPSKMKVLHEHSLEELQASRCKSKVRRDKASSRKFWRVKKRPLEPYYDGFQARGVESIDLVIPNYET